MKKVNNVKLYPELAWGANPDTINGLRCDINKTVSDMSNDAGEHMLVTLLTLLNGAMLNKYLLR